MRLPARAAELVRGQVDFIAVCRPRTNPTTNSRSCRVRCALRGHDRLADHRAHAAGSEGPNPAAGRGCRLPGPDEQPRSRPRAVVEAETQSARPSVSVTLTWSAAAGGVTSYVVRAGSAPGLSNNADYDNMLDGHHAHRQRAVRNVFTCAFMCETPAASGGASNEFILAI